MDSAAGVATSENRLMNAGSALAGAAPPERAWRRVLSAVPLPDKQVRIGIAVQRFHSSYFSWLVEAATNSMRSVGCDAVVLSTRGTARGERDAFEAYGSMGCEAFLVLPQSLDDHELGSLMHQHPGAVLINRYLAEFAERCVYNDDHYGGKVAAEHFLANGHEEIAIVTGPQFMPEVRERTAGFLQALAEQGIEIPASRIVEGHFNEQTGGAAFERLLQTAPQVTGVFFQNDHMAIGALLTAMRIGIKVPDDISIIGYDDIDDSRRVLPALTTVHQPLDRIASHAAQLAMGMLDLPSANNFNLLKSSSRYQPEVCVRQSVRNLNTMTTRSTRDSRHLTPRELECLHWTAQGKTSWEIACILGIAENTITFHLRNTIRKLDASNRVHAVAKALHDGLIKF